MKCRIFQTIILVLSLVNCGLANSNMLSKQNNIPVNKERLYQHIRNITSVTPFRNFSNIASLNQTADYIYTQFSSFTNDVNVQNYNVGDKEYKNIICSFGPMDKERIIIGAHYDVCGEQPGADDNASGVAGLLEIARLMSELKPELKNRIDLVAYSLEEPPFFRTEFMGSAIHAKSLKQAGVKIKLMICLEMIGYFSEEPRSQHYPVFFLRWFYPDRADFISIVGQFEQEIISKKIKKYMNEASKVRSYVLLGPKFIPGIDFSDHLNYWNEGYEAVMITDTAFNRNNNYHQLTDTIETLNFEKMAEVVKGVYWTVVNL